MIRVLVVEDSPTARALIVEVLRSDPEIEVVGEAHTGVEAVDLTLSLRPDLVTMDIEMPVMDGLLAAREIMERAPTPIVIVSSSSNRHESDRSLEAMASGALTVINKPGHVLAPDFDEWQSQLLATVHAMAHVKVVRRLSRRSGSVTPVHNRATPERASMSPASAATSSAGATPKLVAIAASTGGPAALLEILRPLPADFPLPILVVQHIAHGFAGALADWLNSGCRLDVKLATHRERLQAGTIYLAPDDHQIGVREGLAVLASPSGQGFCPSATHLFSSVARAYGDAVLAVILTGMGSDGVAGLRDIRDAGGRVFAQDEASCVVFGMPREAIRAGVVDAVLSPREIANQLLQLIRRNHAPHPNPRRRG